MIDKAKIEKRILEEYENFVFQGYSIEEISYMGTCLQRWAIEKRVGPANIKPGVITKPNPDYWLKPLIVPVNTNMLQTMAVHGALCLALRHPHFKGRSRKLVVEFTKSLGEWLVHAGALTPEQLRSAEELEAMEGSPDLKRTHEEKVCNPDFERCLHEEYRKEIGLEKPGDCKHCENIECKENGEFIE